MAVENQLRGPQRSRVRFRNPRVHQVRGMHPVRSERATMSLVMDVCARSVNDGS